MKYKNQSYKQKKNTYILEVACGHCKTPILIYKKRGKGNLIKLQGHMIIESEFNLKTHVNHLHCLACNEQLANRGTHNGGLTFFVIRGKINSRQLNNYR